MNTMKAVGAIVVVAIIILGVYFFWPQKTGENNDTQPQKADLPVEDFIKDVTHDFDDGVHTIEGVVSLPNPCYELSQDIRIAESFPEQVTINLTTKSTEGICIQVIDDRSFSIDVEVDRNASFNLLLDGKEVSVPQLDSEA